jgi:solute carrier family 10 (sodium/bile acid cotransporter), member 7
MLTFLQQRWFLMGLLAVLVVGIAWPVAMRPVADVISSDVILAVVTFVMALPLETAVLWRAVRKPGPAWLGALINIGIAPPLAWLAGLTLPNELATGVVLAATVPSTLASAAVLTRRAGGNDAVAVLVTIITNLSCFFVIPFWLWTLVRVRADVDFGDIISGLMLLVVLPIIAAQLLRQTSAIGGPATRHKLLLSNVAQVGILVMVLIGAVYCGERLASLESNSPVSLAKIMLMIAVVTAIHVVLVLVGFGASRTLALERADAVGVAFAGSQKTLMVGAYIALAVGPLAILPMVAYHAAQLVVDTLIADWLRQRGSVASLDAQPEL